MDAEQRALNLITRYKPAEIDYEESLRSAAKQLAYYSVVYEQQTRLMTEVADCLELASRRRETLSCDEMFNLSRKICHNS